MWEQELIILITNNEIIQISSSLMKKNQEVEQHIYFYGNPIDIISTIKK
jgi:hypothetical protein